MRALALVLAATFTVGGPLGAQTFLGANAGANDAKQRDQWGPSHGLMGVIAGVSVLHEIRPWVAVEAGLQFSQKGWREGVTALASDYLELPALLRVGIPRTDVDVGHEPGLHPFLAGGVAAAKRLTCYEINPGGSPETGSPPPIEMRFPRDCVGYTDPLDFGLLYGAGITLRGAQRQFSVEVRRTVGLNNVREGPPYHCCRATNDVVSVIAGMSVRVR